MKYIFLFVFSCYFQVTLLAQSGCTDPQATNYDPNATSTNGNCSYAVSSVSLTNPHQFPATLNENSGLTLVDGNLWTLNDGNNPNAIYKINKGDGSILQTVTLSNATNTDWEEITSDANYLYIGDFGNNTNGNRTDLKIYRVAKTDIGSGTSVSVVADIINFSYADQVIQNPVTNGSNHTQYDCEAFVVKDNILHLFTKDWINGYTRHYTLPVTPGTYQAQFEEEFDVKGLITGATISTSNAIALVGYGTNLTDLFMWVLYDYSDNQFFSGNKRRFELGKSVDITNRSNDKGQTEGIVFTTNNGGYIASEQINKVISGIPIIVPPRLYSFTIGTLSTLPIKLLSFSALYKAPATLLSWQTASEYNNAYFSIERSKDGVQFNAIGKKQAAINSNKLLQYSFTDGQPEDGVNYYRIKQVDIDGRFSYSPVLLVKVAHSLQKLAVYPSPLLKGQPLRIELSNTNSSSCTIQLLNASGNKLLQKEVRTTANLNEIITTDNLSAGTYLIRVTTHEQVYTSTVVIY